VGPRVGGEVAVCACEQKVAMKEVHGGRGVGGAVGVRGAVRPR
jgi:hypothetical protein